MKKFFEPEIELRELSPANSVMDDITASGEIPGIDNEKIVDDPATDEATW